VHEHFGFVALIDVVNAYFELEDTFDKEHDLTKTPLEEPCDVFMREESPSLGSDDSFLSKPLDYSHASPLFSVPALSLEYYIDVPIENPIICDTDVDLGYECNMLDVFGGSVLCPQVTLLGIMPPFTHIAYT